MDFGVLVRVRILQMAESVICHLSFSSYSNRKNYDLCPPELWDGVDIKIPSLDNSMLSNYIVQCRMEHPQDQAKT